jgi:Putative adhesin
MRIESPERSHESRLEAREGGAPSAGGTPAGPGGSAFEKATQERVCQGVQSPGEDAAAVSRRYDDRDSVRHVSGESLRRHGISLGFRKGEILCVRAKTDEFAQKLDPGPLREVGDPGPLAETRVPAHIGGNLPPSFAYKAQEVSMDTPSLSKFPLLVAAGVLASALAGATPSREVHKTLPLSADGRLSVSTYKGSITLSVWDRPEVEISARIEPDGDDADQDRRVRATEIRIDGGGSAVHVKTDYSAAEDHHLFHWFNSGSLPFVHYTIRMPGTAKLDIDDYKSQTRVTGVKADVKLHTYKGSVRIEHLDGAADVDTFKGDVEVAFDRYARASRFKTYKGSFEVRLPRDSRFELDADGGRRGEVESDFAVAARRTSRRGGESARGPVNGGGPVLRFESSRGSLRLKGI